MARLIDIDALQRLWMPIDGPLRLGETDFGEGTYMLIEVGRLNELPTVEPPIGKWIPVEERLPEKKGRYWVWAEKFFTPDHVDEPNKYTGSTEAAFIDGIWYGHDLGKVFAWMPLPSPYMGDEK